MVKHLKKLLTFTLILSMVMSMLPSTVAATGAASGEIDTYIYQYNGSRYEASQYDFRFQWMYGSRPIENLRDYTASTGIFQLETVTGTEVFPAYCCDFIESAVEESKYKRLNLEDSTYFDTDVAAHIRGVFQYGYWPGRDLEELQEAANAWLAAYDPSAWQSTVRLPGDAEDPVEPIAGLTREEAITATQFAIWGFANTDSYWMRFSLPDGPTTEHENGRIMGTPFQNNILALRKYLLHQTAVPLTAGDLLFSDQHFISTSAAFSSTGDVGYDISVHFQLKGTIDAGDDLTLTATLGEQTLTRSFTSGSDRLTADENGYYSITFSGVTAESAPDRKITLSLSGTQAVKGVYFYEAKPADPDDKDSARETSQNMVGWYEGSTPVEAAAQVSFDLGEQTISLTKYNADATPVDPPGEEDASVVIVDDQAYPALANVKFDLYAKNTTTQTTHLIRSGLATDEKGQISVSGLPGGYAYFFKESASLPGYIWDPEREYPADSTVAVGNSYDLGSLTATKKVVGLPTDQHFGFSITLDLDRAHLSNAPTLTGTTFPAVWKAGSCGATERHADFIAFVKDETSGLYTARVEMAHDETLTINGIPVGTPYTITEQEGGNLNYRGSGTEETQAPELTYRPDSVNSTGTVPSAGVTADFINRGYIPATIPLQALKTVDHNTPEKYAPFTFELDLWNEETVAWTPVHTTQNHADGHVSFTLPDFDTLHDPQGDAYIYRIREVAGSGAFTYDTAPRYAKVMVTDTDQDGYLEAEAAYYDSFSETTLSLSAPIGDIPTINNRTAPKDTPSYGPDSARWKLTGTKTLDGEPVGGYTFQMTGPNDRVYTVTSSKNGAISFPTQTYSRRGTYTYTIMETAGTDADILYDKAVYTVEVTVDLIGGDYKVTDVTMTKDGQPVDSVIFQNSTTPDTPPSPTPSQTPTPTPSETPAPTPSEPSTTPTPAPSETPAATPSAGQPEQPSVDEDPLSPVPRTGDSHALWPMAAVFSAVGLIALLLWEKKRQGKNP